MKQTVAILLLSLLFFSCSGNENIEKPLTEQQALQEIMQLQRKLAVAEKRKNFTAFEKSLLENYSITLPNGKQLRKSELLLTMKNDEGLFGDVEFKELEIKLLGKSAVVSGKFIVAGKFSGREVKGAYRGVGVFEKRGEDWFVAYEHLGPKIDESESEKESE